jgi:hypothetical protein
MTPPRSVVVRMSATACAPARGLDARSRAASPDAGALVVDRRGGKAGVATGDVGPYVQLRPPRGGRERDVPPEDVRAPPPTEDLSAEVAVVNSAPWTARPHRRARTSPNHRTGCCGTAARTRPTTPTGRSSPGPGGPGGRRDPPRPPRHRTALTHPAPVPAGRDRPWLPRPRQPRQRRALTCVPYPYP